MTKTTNDEIKEALLKPRLTKTSIDKKDLLSTGSTLLNLACTGFPQGGFVKGKYFFIVGDSSSGKTFLSRTLLAEASINKQFKDYRFIYDDVEGGALMDTEKYFGKALAKRMESPATKDDDPIYSDQIEDFYFHLDDALILAEEKNKPFIYVLDSQDALSSKYEEKKFKEKKTAARKKKTAKGDYGDGKAKIHSSGIRMVLSRLRDTKSILIVINQTRDNVGGGMFEEKKSQSGGRALKFYAAVEIWSSVGSAIKKYVRGSERKIGINCRIKVKKNRITGRDRIITLPIYYSHGIDDIGACVDYLIEEEHWKKVKETNKKIDKEVDVILTPGLDFSEPVPTTRDQIISAIEEKGCEFDLQQLVAEVWNEIEIECEIKRKPRY